MRITPTRVPRRLRSIHGVGLPVVACALLSASCSSLQPTTETGFLQGGYASLRPAPEQQVWGIPDEVLLDFTEELRGRIEAGRIQEIYVEPVVYRPVEDPRYQPGDAAARRLEGYATRKMRNALADDFTVVDEPTSGSITVRLALTDMVAVNVWVNSIMTVLLFPVDPGAVSGELEIVDSQTGERLLAMTATRGSTPFLMLEAFNHHGHVRHGIKKWSRMTARMLQGR